MDEIKILVADEDFDFKTRFIHYVLNSCRNVTVQTIENKEIIETDKYRIIDLISTSELVITGDEYLEKIKAVSGKSIAPVICLSDILDEGMKVTDENIFYIYKYQSAYVILNEILKICAEHQLEVRKFNSNGEFSVITVTGASGGVGKTSLCLTFARLRKQYGRRNPLIIDMRSMSDHYMYFPKSESALHEDMNMFLVDYENYGNEPEKYILRDRYGVAEFSMSHEHKTYITDLTRKEMNKFLEVIRSWNIFDVVIFEMGNYLNDASSYLYETSDFIFSLTNQDEKSKLNSEYWEKLIYKYSGNKKFIRIENFAGKKNDNLKIFLNDEDDEFSSNKYYYQLPYDPDSFYVHEGKNDISLIGRYGAAVDRLMKEAVKL